MNGRSRLCALVALAALMSTAGLANADPETPAATETSTSVSTPPSESSQPPTESSPPPSESGTPPSGSGEAQPPAPRAAKVTDVSALEITATFGKPVYKTGELIKVELTFKNTGTEALGPITAIAAGGPEALIYDKRDWGPIDDFPGVTIEPGASYKVNLSGWTQRAESAVGIANFWLHFQDQPRELREFTVPVDKTYGHAAGIVYGDKNTNGKFDDGEGLSDVAVYWAYVHNTSLDDTYRAKTDSTGHFSFPKLPTVRYRSTGDAPAGWIVTTGEFDAVDSDNLRIRAVPILLNELKVSAAFTQDSYQPGDLAHLTVTLSNTGSRTLNGIVAAPNPVAVPGYGFKVSGPGWGALVTDGVTLAPGETKTFDVTETVPEAARAQGYVLAQVLFGFRGAIDWTTSPRATDYATIPGTVGSYFGELRFFPDGQHGTGHHGRPEPGVRVVLVHDGPCPVIGETVSDSNGLFRFTNLTPGLGYKLYVLKPGAVIVGGNPLELSIAAGERTEAQQIWLDPSDAPLPTPPTQPPTCAPANNAPSAVTPQARNLAYTGVDVAGLGVIGALTLLAGAGAVVVTRRRKRQI